MKAFSKTDLVLGIFLVLLFIFIMWYGLSGARHATVSQIIGTQAVLNTGKQEVFIDVKYIKGEVIEGSKLVMGNDKWEVQK